MFLLTLLLNAADFFFFVFFFFFEGARNYSLPCVKREVVCVATFARLVFMAARPQGHTSHALSVP